MMNHTPLNKPTISPNAIQYIKQCLENSSFENGYFTKLASERIISLTGVKVALLTTSCTEALELAAMLLDIGPDDEVIMPSYTFVSTANAFVLRGATPVFVDIRPDTLNIDENLIEAAMTDKTKAIVPVHYAGVGCEMEAIQSIAKKYKLSVIEDAAQGIFATYKNQPLGSFGRMAALSFHHTKNIISGFGGALLINDERLIDRAKILWQKGTNREAFVAGKVDKYTWVDIGSASMLSEINSALLFSQLEQVNELTEKCLSIWYRYHAAFGELLNSKQICALPSIPQHCIHNGHIYYLILSTVKQRNGFIQAMKQNKIETCFHYIPLHSSPAGKKYGKSNNDLKWTDHHAERLVRLPIYAELSDQQVDYIIVTTLQCLENN